MREEPYETTACPGGTRESSRGQASQASAAPVREQQKNSFRPGGTPEEACAVRPRIAFPAPLPGRKMFFGWAIGELRSRCSLAPGYCPWSLRDKAGAPSMG